ncbi:hypothetical protein BDC45DRAFT_494067 [Circinella umbellata]|nr:hypothetical protein BDC45DRAFT_494067 [Circinella umbellata]
MSKFIIKKNDFQDIASGPPIIPRSRTPPPAAIVQPIGLDKEKNKTIFDSDDDESDGDIFFQDFSADRPKSKRISKKVIKKVLDDKSTSLSRFDLSAFANHLHENRLSVMQLRQSNIHLTEEDEKELIQLLEKRKSMAPANTGVQQQQQESSYDNAPSNDLLRPPLPERPMAKKPSLLLQKLKKGNRSAVEDEVMPTPSISASRSQEQLTERKRRVRKSMSMDEIHRMAAMENEKTQVSEVPTVPSIQEDPVDKSPFEPSASTPSLAKWSLHKSHSTRKFAVRSHSDNNNNNENIGTTGSTEKAPRAQSARPTVQRSIGLFGSLRQASRSHQPFRGLVRNLSSAGNYYRARHSSANGTVETGGMSRAAMAVMEHDKSKLRDNSTRSTATLNTKNAFSPSNNDTTTSTPLSDPQVTTSLPTSTITESPNTQEDNSPSETSGGNLLTQLLAKASKAKRTPITKTVNMNHDNNHLNKLNNNTNSNQRREKTKSRIVRRTIIYVPPDSLNFMKTLQQRDDTTSSAGLMRNKNGPAPPLSPDMVEKMRQLQKSSKAATVAAASSPRHSEDDDNSQQTSRNTMSSSNSGGTSSSKIRHDDNDLSATTPTTKDEGIDDDFGSVLNYYDDESLYDYYQNRESIIPRLEGLELREMSDGTVEWGIVKKQGNRKSFYVRDEKRVIEEEDEDENEEKIEEQVLALMGLSVENTNSNNNSNKYSMSSTLTTNTTASSISPPPVPRRSPRRRIDSAEQHIQQQQQQQIDNRRAKHISTIHSRKDASTTDVYFAPQSTLPSLLQMIADSNQDEEQHAKRKKQASVEEQLDEMMRSFQTSNF